MASSNIPDLNRLFPSVFNLTACNSFPNHLSTACDKRTFVLRFPFLSDERKHGKGFLHLWHDFGSVFSKQDLQKV